MKSYPVTIITNRLSSHFEWKPEIFLSKVLGFNHGKLSPFDNVFKLLNVAFKIPRELQEQFEKWKRFLGRIQILFFDSVRSFPNPRCVELHFYPYKMQLRLQVFVRHHRQLHEFIAWGQRKSMHTRKFIIGPSFFENDYSEIDTVNAEWYHQLLEYFLGDRICKGGLIWVERNGHKKRYVIGGKIRLQFSGLSRF